MSSVGSYLREIRERKGVSLNEIARATRVAPRYLAALEADDHAALPEPVFTRGFIRAYCQVLGEPATEAFARYQSRAAAHPAAPARRGAGRGLHADGSRRGTIVVSFVLLVVLGAALLAVTLALQSGRDAGADRHAAAPASETPPEEPDAPAATTVAPTAPAAPVPSAAAPAAPPAPARLSSPALARDGVQAASGPPALPLRGLTAPYHLIARTTEPTWVSVRTGGRTTEETIPAGETREWVSDSPFTLTIGNAGGIALELNGRALPPLGARGAVISRLVLPPEAP